MKAIALPLHEVKLSKYCVNYMFCSCQSGVNAELIGGSGGSEGAEPLPHPTFPPN